MNDMSGESNNEISMRGADLNIKEGSNDIEEGLNIKGGLEQKLGGELLGFGR